MKPSPFVLVVLGVSALVLVALVQLSEILLPFVLGFTLAYFLDPLADRLERAGLPRLLATNVITFAFGFAVLAGLVLGLPALAAELRRNRSRQGQTGNLRAGLETQLADVLGRDDLSHGGAR